MAESARASDGFVEVWPIERVLPDAVRRASGARDQLTLLMFRPGRGPVPSAGGAVPPAAEVADLTAALSVSLDQDQRLMDAGQGRIAVLLQGASKRSALRLASRAAACGAPAFTWVAAKFPKDAQTPRGLAQVAASRLAAGTGGARLSVVGDDDSDSSSRLKKMWAVAAACALVVAILLLSHIVGGAQNHRTHGVRPGGVVSAGGPGAHSSTGGAASGASPGGNVLAGSSKSPTSHSGERASGTGGGGSGQSGGGQQGGGGSGGSGGGTTNSNSTTTTTTAAGSTTTTTTAAGSTTTTTAPAGATTTTTVPCIISLLQPVCNAVGGLG